MSRHRLRTGSKADRPSGTGKPLGIPVARQFLAKAWPTLGLIVLVAGCSDSGSRGAWPDLDLRTSVERDAGPDASTHLRAGVRIGIEAGLRRADLAQANVATSRLQNHEAAAEIQRQTAQERRRQAEALAADGTLAAARALCTATEARLTRLTTAQTQGQATKLEVLDARTSTLAALMVLTEAQRRAEAAGPLPAAVAATPSAPPWLEQEVLTLAGEAIIRRSDLSALRDRVAVERSRTAAARQRGLVPDSLDLGVEHQADQEGDPTWTWTAGLVFSLPVPDANLIRHRLDLETAQARSRQAEARLTEDLAQAHRRAKAAWQAWDGWERESSQVLAALEAEVGALSTTDRDQATARLNLLERLADLRRQRAGLLGAWHLAQAEVEALLALP